MHPTHTRDRPEGRRHERDRPTGRPPASVQADRIPGQDGYGCSRPDGVETQADPGL